MVPLAGADTQVQFWPTSVPISLFKIYLTVFSFTYEPNSLVWKGKVLWKVWGSTVYLHQGLLTWQGTGMTKVRGLQMEKISDKWCTVCYLIETVTINSVIPFDEMMTMTTKKRKVMLLLKTYWAIPTCQKWSCALCSHPLNNPKRQLPLWFPAYAWGNWSSVG